MSTVTLINGAPASGKSTLARLLAQDRPMTLVLDVDSVRGLLSCWESDPTAAGLAARRLALTMCEAHLSTGEDVIVPQFLQRDEFLDELNAVAVRVRSRCLEVCLVNTPEDSLAQFAERAQSGDPNHLAAEALQSRVEATPIEDLHQAMRDMVSRRPQTIFVRSTPGDVESTLNNLREVME